jgi:ATP-binding cassette subfamily F protein uup
MSLSLPVGGRLGKTVLELRGLGRSAGGKTLFRGLDLIVKPGDRIGVVGPNGAGKTTLVRTILGLERADEGEVVVGQNTRFASLDQGRAELRDDRTVMQEVADGAAEVELGEGSVPVRTFLRMMLFDDAFADTPVGVLSGGERSRVQLAKLLRRGGNFLVLDEPTNDLDLVTLSVLEEALASFGGCALVVSHDRWFLDRVATAVLVFEGDGRVGFYEGGYAQYLQSRPKPVAPAPSAPPPPAPRVRPAAPKKLTHRERAELEGMEAAVLAAEARVTELEATLSDPTVYRDRALEVPALVAALAGARADTERLYARWQELESIGKG